MCSTMSQLEKKHGYDGSRLKTQIAKLVAPLDEKKQILKPMQIQTPKLIAKPSPEIKPVSKVGFSKITVTITEEMALSILNYAGHSSKKEATIDVFYAQHKPTYVENVAPVYPLAQLYKSSV